MAQLEYRLLDEAKTYPMLYYYSDIAMEEIAARFACDYFVINRIVYEKMSCAVEAGRYVMYVKHDAEAEVLDEHSSGKTQGIRLELRHYVENTGYYPLVTSFSFNSHLDILLHLQSDFLYWLGQEWQKTSAEMDEDRKAYVYYAEPTS
jgi:hypothetical protein